MSILLTPEERDSHCYKISTSPLKGEYLFSEQLGIPDNTLNPGPFVRVDDMLKHQVRKVIGEIDRLWTIVSLKKWIEAVRKEVT